MRRLIKSRLLLRWARIIQQDVVREGFWDEVHSVGVHFIESEVRNFVATEAERLEKRAGGRPQPNPESEGPARCVHGNALADCDHCVNGLRGDESEASR